MDANVWNYLNSISDKKSFTQAEPGEQICRVMFAEYDQDTQRFKIQWKSFLNGAEFQQTLFLLKKTGEPNGFSIRLLREIAASGYGVPPETASTDGEMTLEKAMTQLTEDLMGLTIWTTVSLEPSKTDPSKSFAKVVETQPLNEWDLEGLGDEYRPDQFFKVAE